MQGCILTSAGHMKDSAQFYRAHEWLYDSVGYTKGCIEPCEVHEDDRG